MSALADQTGRSGSGNLRNFKAMSDEKLLGVLAAVREEANDPEALGALEAIAGERGITPGTSDAVVAASSRNAAAVKRQAGSRGVAPMLCAKVDEVPNGGNWTYEVKWDGFRCVAVVQGGEVSLWSRSDKTLTFPQIAASLADLPDCVLDGEVAVLTQTDKGGDFQRLVDGHPNAVYVAFDVLEAEGADTRGLPVEDRRDLLEALLADAGASVQQSPWFEHDDLDALLDQVAAFGFEGVVAKRKGSTYKDGARGPAWAKFKVRQEQEFVVVGWVEGEGRAAGRMGALLLAVRDGDGLVYCGKVGTGWDDAEARRLTDELEQVAASEQRYVGKAEKGTTFVEPELVVQVAFQRWTSDGILWHPSYRGQRHDKAAGDVVRES